MLKEVVESNIGYNIAGIYILTHADDMVLLAALWKGLQLDIIGKAAANIDMSIDTNKTVCIIYNPCVKYKRYSDNFP